MCKDGGSRFRAENLGNLLHADGRFDTS
ncbi:hypothetical protein FAIPA1_50150 [Frankia sp. AiPs1]